MKKARKSLARMTSILGQEGADPGVSGMFFKAVVQTVLLFGSETWVLTPPHGTVPRKFSAQGCIEDHHEAAWEARRGGMEVSTYGASYGGGGF